MARPRTIHLNIDPREMGTLLQRGWIAKRLYFDNSAVSIEMDVTIGFSDTALGRRLVNDLKRAARTSSPKDEAVQGGA